MIESFYWKKDILKYAKKLKKKNKPKDWTEKSQVNFEKQIIIHFFMIRKLLESFKLSSKSQNYSSKIYASPVKNKRINNRNYFDIDSLYNLDKEIIKTKSIKFICNQIIHSGAIYAYKNQNKEWAGIYTCSDFERSKFIYKIPLKEIINIFSIVGRDYPTSIKYEYSISKNDYIISTN